MTVERSASEPDVGFVLVASPFTGPFAWSKVASVLRARGRRVAVRDADVGIDAPVVLVAHSGGGPQLPGAGRGDARGRRHGARRRAAPASRAGAGRRPCPRRSSTKLKAERGRTAGSRRGRSGGATTACATLLPDDELRDEFVALVPGGSGRRDRRGDARGPRADRGVRAAERRPTRPRPRRRVRAAGR